MSDCSATRCNVAAACSVWVTFLAVAAFFSLNSDCEPIKPMFCDRFSVLRPEAYIFDCVIDDVSDTFGSVDALSSFAAA